MTRKFASLFATLTLTLGPAAVAAEHGGAIPNNLSFYESAEFADVQWASGRDGQPAWGSLVLDGAEGVRFVPDNGAETRIAYSEIKAIRYERVVKQKEKPTNQKWFQRPFNFARGVDTYRAVTIERHTSEGNSVSQMRLDGENAAGIVRLLEIKTGLRAKRLSSL